MPVRPTLLLCLNSLILRISDTSYGDDPPNDLQLPSLLCDKGYTPGKEFALAEPMFLK